jgi:hypothetical protein
MDRGDPSSNSFIHHPADRMEGAWAKGFSTGTVLERRRERRLSMSHIIDVVLPDAYRV